jgi:hypothetical protein
MMAILPGIEDIIYEKVLIERLPIHARLILAGLDNLSIRKTFDLEYAAAGQMVMQLTAFINGLKLGSITVRYPENWWQAFREHWFPQWWLKSHPVQYTSRTIEAYEWADKLKLPDTYSSHAVLIRESPWNSQSSTTAT